MEPLQIADLPAAIRAVKKQLRAQLPNYRDVFEQVEAEIKRKAGVIAAERARGEPVIPEIRFADIGAGRVSGEQIALVKERGACVVRGVFTPERASRWDTQIAAYVEANRLDERLAHRAEDKYFGNLASSKPQIFGIYWSRPQVEARQSAELTETRVFLNRLWKWNSEGRVHFDPERVPVYADRLRRRPPGSESLGLSAHCDGGSVERWCEPTFRHVYREVFYGDPLAFDPFDAEGRTTTKEIPSPAVCSAFRTFQGWTALTKQGPGDGTLKLVPIAKTTPWMLIRALQNDVPDGDLCGAQPGRALGAFPAWHAELLEGLVSIPEVGPGDTVWWHSDVIHAVEDKHGGSGYSNVIYIGGAPWCDKIRCSSSVTSSADTPG